MKLNDLIPNKGAKRTVNALAGVFQLARQDCRQRHQRPNTRSASGHLCQRGGNLPFYRRLPFIRGEGFTRRTVTYNEVNLSQLAVKFEANNVVTAAALAEKNMLHKPANPVVILGRGEITFPLTVRVQRVTKGAQTKIEAAGGKVEIVP